MNIYLIRHGDAEKSTINKKDFDRELTGSGKTKIKSAAINWKNLIENINCIVTSPLVRALQTAEIIADVFQIKNKLITDKKLSPGSNSACIVEIANSLNEEDIAFVGHQPDLSEQLSDLISSKEAYIDFKKGAIAKISFDNKIRLSGGTLEFLIPVSAYTKS